MFPVLRNLQYSERLNKLGLWTLEKRRNRADLIEVFKILSGFSIVPVDTFFALSDDTRTRGHSMKLLKRRCNKDLRHHFFSERVVNRWNKLPSYTVEAKSVNQFKSVLQKLRNTQIGFFWMIQHLPNRQAACYHHTLSDELVADQVNDLRSCEITPKACVIIPFILYHF